MSVASNEQAWLNTLSGLLTYANGVTGESDTNLGDAVRTLADGYGGGGGLPTGFTAIATGTHTLSEDVPGGSTFTVTHNLGQTPDLFIFYHEGNIALTATMMLAMRCNKFNWRGTSYLNICAYHTTSTASVSCSNINTSYGIKTINTTSAVITTYNSQDTYFWRAETYKWVAIKF